MYVHDSGLAYLDLIVMISEDEDKQSGAVSAHVSRKLSFPYSLPHPLFCRGAEPTSKKRKPCYCGIVSKPHARNKHIP